MIATSSKKKKGKHTQQHDKKKLFSFFSFHQEKRKTKKYYMYQVYKKKNESIYEFYVVFFFLHVAGSSDTSVNSYLFSNVAIRDLISSSAISCPMHFLAPPLKCGYAPMPNTVSGILFFMFSFPCSFSASSPNRSGINSAAWGPQIDSIRPMP